MNPHGNMAVAEDGCSNPLRIRVSVLNCKKLDQREERYARSGTIATSGPIQSIY